MVSLFGTARAEPPTLLVLGDSLSAAFGIRPDQGWVRLLERRLEDQGLAYRLVNASISGETTAGGVFRLPALLAEHRPSVVVIALGANDGLRGFPLTQTRDNLRRLVEMARESGARVLLVGVRLPPNYGAAYLVRFQATFAEVARAAGVPLAPRLLEGVGDDWSLMQADGYHPTAEAQPQLLENVWPHLRPLLEHSEGEGTPTQGGGDRKP